jgi:Alpha/beta hydrolase
MKLITFITFGLSALLTIGTTTLGAWLAPDPYQADGGLPEAPRWQAAVAATAPGIAAPDPATASVDQVRRFFARLTAGQRDALARQAPGVVGNLDGAPYEVRFAANDRARRATRASGPRSSAMLLGYDPRGDGRLIQVFGDLAAARHVAVIVPGSGWHLTNLLTRTDQPGADPITSAGALRRELNLLDPRARVAVVVWLGYDAPEDVDRQAARSERAVAGAGSLVRFVEGLPRQAHVSLLCHSYGAVVCGRAAHAERIGELVTLAAPGMDVSSAAGLRTSAQVWAARTADDPIRFVPKLRVNGFGHGADPAGPRFGARVFSTGDARGHDAYYAPGSESLANLARITLGRDQEVTRA